MSDDELKILIRELIQTNKEIKNELSSIKNLFLKYDIEELLNDEFLRND